MDSLVHIARGNLFTLGIQKNCPKGKALSSLSKLDLL